MSTMSYSKRRSWAPAILILLSTSPAFCQAVSQISGTVKDMSGAVVSEVRVKLSQVDMGTSREALTDDNGAFVVTNLPVGPYRIEASKSGFQTYVQTGIQLQVDSSPSIPITLGVGSVNQSVEVEANASLVDTQKLGMGTVME